MSKFIAAVPSSHHKDDIAHLVIEFDPASDGWFLYGASSLEAAPSFELWNMSKEDAMEVAANDWGVEPHFWSAAGGDAGAKTVDCNGAELKDGDDVTLIKDLDVKGAGVTLKRGTLVKNISLTNNPEEIDCKTKEVRGLVLKTCFVKKV